MQRMPTAGAGAALVVPMSQSDRRAGPCPGVYVGIDLSTIFTLEDDSDIAMANQLVIGGFTSAVRKT